MTKDLKSFNRIKHQAIGDNVQMFQQMISNLPQKEKVIFSFQKYLLPIIASLVDMIKSVRYHKFKK